MNGAWFPQVCSCSTIAARPAETCENAGICLLYAGHPTIGFGAR